MDDDRVWDFETGLWTGDGDHYRALIDAACVMVLPVPPFVHAGEAAVAAVSDTPRWRAATLDERRIARPQEGLIVVAYHVRASRDHDVYEARCTSTYRRRDRDDWQVVQHQQTPLPLGQPAT